MSSFKIPGMESSPCHRHVVAATEGVDSKGMGTIAVLASLAVEASARGMAHHDMPQFKAG